MLILMLIYVSELCPCAVYKSNTINTQHLAVNNITPISCKTVLLTGQEFIDLLPAIELLTDDLIFLLVQYVTRY